MIAASVIPTRIAVWLGVETKVEAKVDAVHLCGF